MIRSTAIFCGVAAVALAGCSGKSDDAAAPAEPTDAASALPVATAAPTTADSGTGTGIPDGIYGRWALVPADCTSTAGDAKGLLIIDAAGLKFYESRAKLGKVQERGDSRIRATYAFSGEGQEWTQDVLLDLQDGGKKLVRRDYGPDAMPGALEYTRCEDTEGQ